MSPTFASPPVVETALSIQFGGVSWTTLSFGQAYDRVLKTDYPKFRQEADLPPIVESFPATPKVPGLSFTDKPGPGRGMYTAANESTLIQIQSNRFGFNWKRSSDDEQYPRFSVNLETFRREYERFVQFCHDENIGTPAPTFCEVVYVNRIEPQESESTSQLMDAVFGGLHVSAAWMEPELVSFNRTFVLGDQAGRLYAEAGAVPGAHPLIAFKLTSRLRCSGEGPIVALQQAHDSLIECFIGLTKEECRKGRWGQQNDE